MSEYTTAVVSSSSERSEPARKTKRQWGCDFGQVCSAGFCSYNISQNGARVSEASKASSNNETSESQNPLTDVVWTDI